jgi:hypothetical protein
MHRFRILDFYVAGLVAMVGLSIGAVSMKRSAAGYGRRVSETVSLTIPSKTLPDTRQPRYPGTSFSAQVRSPRALKFQPSNSSGDASGMRVDIHTPISGRSSIREECQHERSF